jgi:hypothetical protein
VLSKYVSGGNPRIVQRLTAERITNRYQTVYPWAAQLDDSATVQIARQSGAVETYTGDVVKPDRPAIRDIDIARGRRRRVTRVARTQEFSRTSR